MPDPASSPTSIPGPLSTEERTRLLRTINEIALQIRDGARERPRMPPLVRAQLLEKQQAFLDQYYQRLPIFTLSRCPVCNEPLTSTFDPWGLDGFWWQESLSGRRPDPRGCSHFRVLTGALNLNDLPPRGGEAEAYPGPEVPYVIPKVLELPTMVAVIHQVNMKNGYTAFPIAYFSAEKPASLLLANPWTRRSCSYRTPDGRSGFAYKTDPWDFELRPWLDQNKLRWLEPGDPECRLSQRHHLEFPFADLKGRRLQQTIVDERVLTAPPPHGEKIDPFTD